MVSTFQSLDYEAASPTPVWCRVDGRDLPHGPKEFLLRICEDDTPSSVEIVILYFHFGVLQKRPIKGAIPAADNSIAGGLKSEPSTPSSLTDDCLHFRNRRDSEEVPWESLYWQMLVPTGAWPTPETPLLELSSWAGGSLNMTQRFVVTPPFARARLNLVTLTLIARVNCHTALALRAC